MLKLLAVPLLLLPLTALTQDAPREIWDTGFMQKRPAKAANAPKAPMHASYRAGVSETADTRVYDEAACGLTVWRLRPPASHDTDGARLLIPEKAGGATREYVAERVDASSSLHEGDRIRLGIEVPREGFLYVIDRERYRNGSFGEPVLLFPTLDIADGANEVSAGRLVEIPPQNSSIKALRIARRGTEHIGEDLLVIVSPSRIEEIVPTEGMQTLPVALVDRWDKDWSVSNVKLNLENPAERLWGISEQRAGASRQTLLTQSDPLPGTLITIPHQRSKAVLLVHVLLTIE